MHRFTLLLAISLIGFTAGVLAEEKPAEAQCKQCHVSDQPTKESHELSPCPRNKDMSASAHGAGEAPDYFIMDQLVKMYTPVVFPHKLHAGMSEMGVGCSRCHHHSEGGKIPQCRECHEPSSSQDNLEQPSLKGAYHRQCLGCHREWSHETKCGVCHAKQGDDAGKALPQDNSDVVGRLHPNVQIPATKVYQNKDLGEEMAYISFHHGDHSQKFGRTCAECHRKWDCNSCHAEGENGQKAPGKKNQFEGMNLHDACGICHAQQISDNCAFCHDSKERPAFDHERRTKFALRPYHAKLDCTACHKKRGEFKGLTPQCETCHKENWPPAQFDHAQVGLTLDDTHSAIECKECHADGLSAPRTCKNCHDDGRQAFPAPKDEKEKTAAPAPEAASPPAEKPATPPAAAAPEATPPATPAAEPAKPAETPAKPEPKHRRHREDDDEPAAQSVPAQPAPAPANSAPADNAPKAAPAASTAPASAPAPTPGQRRHRREDDDR